MQNQIEQIKKMPGVKLVEVHGNTVITVFADEIKRGCTTCKYTDGWKCNHPHGCELDDYELWELKKNYDKTKESE